MRSDTKDPGNSGYVEFGSKVLLRTFGSIHFHIENGMSYGGEIFTPRMFTIWLFVSHITGHMNPVISVLKREITGFILCGRLKHAQYRSTVRNTKIL